MPNFQRLMKIPHLRRYPRHLRNLILHSTPRRLANLLTVEVEYRMHKTELRGKPYVIFVDPINLCNLKCPLCPTGTGSLQRAQGQMKLDEFKHVIDHVSPWAYEVVLYNWGEPLMNHQIFEMVEYAHSKNLGTSMSSNLTVVRPGAIDSLVESGLENLTVSIDGASQETYGKYRVGGDFGKVMTNLRALLERREQLGRHNPIVEWQFIVMRHNEHEIEQARAMANDVGVDLVSFIPVALPFEVKGPEAAAMEEEWFSTHPEYRYKEAATGWSVTKGPWRRWFSWLPQYRGLDKTAGSGRDMEDTRVPCFYLYRSITVNPGGGVAPCCIIYDEKADVGTLNEEQGLDAFWNSERYRSSRAEFSSTETPTESTICTRCEIFAKPKRAPAKTPAPIVEAESLRDGAIPLELVGPAQATHKQGRKDTPMKQGVILAAGRGSRIRPFSDHFPKPLLPICNKPVMQYQVEAMRDAGIDDITVVVGHRGEQIRGHFGDGGSLGVRMRYVVDENPQGIAASLLTARDAVHGPFALFLGDIFIALDDLAPAMRRMAERGADGAVIVRQEPDLDVIRLNFSVVADGDGRISRVIEKPADPPSNLKGCGVYIFTPSIFEAIDRTPRSSLRNEYEITDAIQTLVDMGTGVYSEELARWDWNITFPGDLLDLNLKVLGEQRLDYLLGAGAVVSENTQLVNSIVGDRAVIEAPSLIEECLVLADCRVDRNYGSIRRHIFADGLTWAA